MSSAPLPPPSAPAPSAMAFAMEPARPYRSPARLAAALRCCLIGAVLASALDAAAFVAAHQLIGRVQSEPAMVDPDTVTAVERWTVATSVAQTVFLLIAFGLLVAWTSCAYRNLSAFGMRGLRFSEGWAVGAWFVPVLNFVRPKAIVDDTWRGSAVDDSSGDGWRARRVPAFIHWWWGSRILAWILAIASTAEPSRLEDVRSGATTAVTADVVMIVALLLEMIVVTRLTDRQRSRFGGVSAPGRFPWTLAAGATVLLAVGAFLVGVGAASTRVSDSTGGSHRRALIMSLAVGQCFDFPSEGQQDPATDVEVFGVEVMPCEEPHDNEIVGVFDDDADAAAPYPGLQELMATVSDRCLDEFETWVDTTFETSSLDVRVIGPSADGWSLGDRTILCTASRVDEQKLDGSVRASGI